MVAAGRRPGVVFLVAALVVVTASLLATRLRFDPDVLHLLPQRNEGVNNYRETITDFGNVDYFVAAVRIPEGVPLDPFLDFADALAERMREGGLFHGVEHEIGEPETILAEFLPRSALFLDADERDELAQRLTDERILERAQELRRTLEMPQAIALRDLLRLDPLGLAEIFLDRLGSGRGPLNVDWTSGRYLSRDHRVVLVLGRPVQPPQDLAFNHRLLESMNAEATALIEEWPEFTDGLELAAPEVFWGGRYVIALDDEALIWKDVWVNAVSSVGGVLVLFWLAYRRFSLLALVFSPLFCGLAITFGFASVAVGVLASTTAGVAALLVGLGDDFVIVLYGRYVAERWRGASVEDSIRAMGGSTVRGVILGAITTAATFYAFLITDFTGLFQMGLIVGTGILFCVAAVIFLVPAMISWSEQHHRRRQREPRLHIFAFGAERLTRLAMQRPRATMAIAALITLVAAVLAPQVQFDDSVERLRPKGNRGILAQEEINRHFGSGFDHMSLVVRGDTLEETLALAERAAEGAHERVEAGQLGGFDGVASVLPALGHQREALDWLAAGRESGALDPQRVRASFESAVRAEGLRPEAFARGLDLLERALSIHEPLTYEAVAAIGHGRTLLDRYLRQREDGWKSIVRIYNVPGASKRDIPAAAVELTAELGPRATLSGMNLLSAALRSEVRRDAFLAALIGLLLVVVLLWADFRSVRAAVLAFIPLALGIVWMLGAMVAIGLQLNVMNVFVITMVLGIGVDYGIHVIHRFLEERERPGGSIVDAVEETSRGVLLAALTTMVGFGSLATSHYPGLVSMGLVSILGTLSTALVAIAVVPAWLAMRHRIDFSSHDVP